MKEPKEYALYDDDTFIMIGTIKEIAEELGIKLVDVDLSEARTETIGTCELACEVEYE